METPNREGQAQGHLPLPPLQALPRDHKILGSERHAQHRTAWTCELKPSFEGKSPSIHPLCGTQQ